MTVRSDLLDPPLLEQASKAAEEEGVPLRQFLSAIVAEALATRAFFNERVKGADREKFRAVWETAGDEPPIPGDELPEGFARRPAAE